MNEMPWQTDNDLRKSENEHRACQKMGFLCAWIIIIENKSFLVLMAPKQATIHDT